MAKMTGSGALPGKQILDLIKEPVLQCSIFIIGSPKAPPPEMKYYRHVLTPTVSTNEVLPTRINTNGFNKLSTTNTC
jgi:hypothetical protein